MATVITSECINCGACEPECPNTAIYQGGVEWELNGEMHAPLATDIFYIVPEKCTECVGFHDQEACAVVCPVDCCVPNPDIPETEEVLIARAKQLHPEMEVPADFPSRFKPAGAGRAPMAPAAAAPRPAATAKPAAPPTAPTPAPAVAAAPPPLPAAKPAVTPALKPATPAPAETSTAVSSQPAPAATPAPPSNPAFPGELPIAFEDAVTLLKTSAGERLGLGKRLRALAQPLLDALPAPVGRLIQRPAEQGSVGLDGFTDLRFEEKLERERRYGEVYRLSEEPNGFLLEMEFPRRVPPSAIKEELGVPDEMPDYDYGLSLRNGFFTVKGRVPDPKVRKIAAFSPAFPPDFEIHIKLPTPVNGFKHRFRGKDLEVALIRQV